MSAAKNVAIFVTLTVLMSVTGCASLSDGHYERTQKFRTMKAWYHYSWSSEDKFSCHYRDGWKAGYYDVLTGNCGKAPLVPPQKYWCPSQITNHCDLNRYEWYIGFHDGANCARMTPDTHYIKTWMPEYCESETYGSSISETPLIPLPSIPSSEMTEESAAALPELPSP